MSPDTVVTLGDIAFRDFEVPDSIPFGGSQALTVHKLQGGVRVVDAMGAEEGDLTWSGRFRGPDGVDRALYLDAKRMAGRPLQLTWGRLAYTVIIERFEPLSQANGEVPYSITCVVVTNDTQPVTVLPQVSIDDQVAEDDLAATAISDRVANPALSSRFETMSSAISNVRGFATSSLATLNGVLQPVLAAKATAQALFDEGQGIIATASALGGVGGALTAAQMAAGLLTQLDAHSDAADLFDAVNLTGRLARNVLDAGNGGSDIEVAGADLFRLAAQAYGDATEWATIARANGLTDPVVSGVRTLTIPPSPAKQGGVLGV